MESHSSTDAVVLGGQTYDLIDESRFLVSPVILGKGRKLLDDAAKSKLKPLETSPHKSGHVMLRHSLAKE